MNVRKQIVFALVALAAPLAASAASPATAGEVEATQRSGLSAPLVADAPVQGTDFTSRFHAAVIQGASYNQASELAKAYRPSQDAATSRQEVRELLRERGNLDYAVASTTLAPTKG